MNNEMPDEIWAGTYFDQETQNEWRERKMTGSEKYHHSSVVEALRKENEENCRLLGMSAERELALLAEIDRLKAKLAKTEWQLIESAPKNRTIIVINGDKHGYCTEPFQIGVVEWNKCLGEYQWGSTACCDGVTYFKPTHWMPLPEPPTTEETK